MDSAVPDQCLVMGTDLTHSYNDQNLYHDYTTSAQAHSRLYGNVGLGIAMPVSNHDTLPELLKNIAAYEQAVGRAYLLSQGNCGSRSPRSPRDTRASKWQTPEPSPILTQDELASTPLDGHARFQYRYPPTPVAAYPDESAHWHTPKRPGYQRSHTSPYPTHSRMTSWQSFPRSSSIENPISVAGFGNLDQSFDPQDELDIAVASVPSPYGSQASPGSVGSGHISDADMAQSSAPLVDDFSTKDLEYQVQGPTLLVNHQPNHSSNGKAVRSVAPQKSAWSPEEDNLLRQEVRLHQATEGSTLSWTKVAMKLHGHTGVQCQARWAEVLDESIRKGRWSVSEDDLLKRYHAQFGSQWSKIAGSLKTRTQRQCRSRWLQIFSSSQ